MTSDSIAQDELRSVYDRWLRLEEAKAEVGDGLKELFGEAKGQGWDTKALRASFRRVRDLEDSEKRSEVMEVDALVDLYVTSLLGTKLAMRGTRESFDPETGEFSDDNSNPVANAGEGADGAIAAASVDPASRVTDDADRQQLAVAGFTGDAAVASPKTVRDTSDEPGREAPAAQIPTPDDGGNTVEPDSGAALTGLGGGVATLSPETATTDPGALAMPVGSAGSGCTGEKDRHFHSQSTERPGAGSPLADVTAGETAPISANHEATDKPGVEQSAPAPDNPLCQKLKRGETCIFAHKGYSCADCNYAWAIDRVKKREAA